MIKVFSGVGFPTSSQIIARYEWGNWDANGYYDALGLTPGCTFLEIKHAYRNLARQYHPDGSSPDIEKFREIREIYEVLNDPVLRGEYSRIDPSTGEFFLGNLEKQILHDFAAMQGTSPEDFVKTDKEPDKVFDYFSEKEDCGRAQAWYSYVLLAAYLYRYRGPIRIGISPDQKFNGPNKNDYLIFWFHPDITPNWITAFIAVSKICNFA